MFVNALNQTLGFFVEKSEFNKALFILHAFAVGRCRKSQDDRGTLMLSFTTVNILNRHITQVQDIRFNCIDDKNV